MCRVSTSWVRRSRQQMSVPTDRQPVAQRNATLRWPRRDRRICDPRSFLIFNQLTFPIQPHFYQQCTSSMLQSVVLIRGRYSEFKRALVIARDLNQVHPILAGFIDLQLRAGKLEYVN